MNKEIKEILDKLLKYFKESNVNDFGYEQDKLISYEEAQILLDYINNLKEENERLKIEKQEEYNRFNLMAKFRDKALVRELIYKSRCEKAIDCLTKNKYYINLNEVLNILNGD